MCVCVCVKKSGDTGRAQHSTHRELLTSLLALFSKEYSVMATTEVGPVCV